MTRGSRFFTSDGHFGHANIIRYTHRPYASVEEMNDDLVRRWGSIVGEDDEVWYLGDLALGHLVDSLHWVARLPGRIVLVPGNHDRVAAYHKNAGRFVETYLQAGISEIIQGPIEIEIAGEPVLVDHFPYRGDSGERDRYVDQRPRDQGRWLLHGHVHAKWRELGHQINVGVDAWAGYPVPEGQLAALITAGESDLQPLDWR